MFDPYRPELYYLRGSGPRWRERCGITARNGEEPHDWVGLRRRRISLPALKYGMDFPSTETVTPVRGLRPGRAERCLTEKLPKPRSSIRSPRAIAAMMASRMAFTMLSTSRR
jgi:hypothetical protein